MEQEEEACSTCCSSPLRQCRICHDEEDERRSAMESPCACSGSLKVRALIRTTGSCMLFSTACSSRLEWYGSSRLQYAHRGCVQRWCDEKGSTVCEICLQVCRTDRPILPGFSPAHRPTVLAMEASTFPELVLHENLIRVAFRACLWKWSILFVIGEHRSI
jgi:hypothetical protein